MIDSERARKMNELFGELKKHKLQDETMERAEEIVLENDSVQKKEEPQDNRRLIAEINLLKSAVGKLRLEIDSIKDELASLRQKPEVNEEKAPEIKKDDVPSAHDLKPEFHPKQGNFHSDDVSVDKFFYFGGKK